MKPHRLTRRQFIPRAAGVLAALGAGGVGGYELHGSTTVKERPKTDAAPGVDSVPGAGAPGSGVASFVTRPDLHPALTRVDNLALPVGDDFAPRHIVLAPMSYPQYDGLQRGPMIIDRRGRLVWYHPESGSTFDAQVQTYDGKPVLTWWNGHLDGGHGLGQGKIMDETYKLVATVGDADSLPLDLHEFNLTERGTALATQFDTIPADLSPIGGPQHGTLLNCHVLEIDIASGKVLLDWSAIEHVDISESHQPVPSNSQTAYDFIHTNSIGVADDGNLLISGRHTWAVYKIHRRSGKVMWRLGGKRSNFKIPKDARFSWQHHVRAHPGTQLTMFNNANTSDHGSTGLLLKLHETARTAELVHAYQHPAKFLAWNMGSVQLWRDGRVFVGWGAQPYLSEFSADGKLLVDGQFDSVTRSYRAFMTDWVGRPTYRPVIQARANTYVTNGGFTIYASWNGATEIDHWTVLAGPNALSLEPVGSQPWSGFETTIVVNSPGPSFAAVAVDRNGQELGRSEVV